MYKLTKQMRTNNMKQVQDLKQDQMQQSEVK